MLADDILAARGSTLDTLTLGDVSRLAEALVDTKRFDLSPGVVRTAMTVAESPLSSQLRALPLCRFPFRKVWWERPGADPQYDPHLNHNDNTLRPRPQRIGVLIETDETAQVGKMTFAWSHSQHGISISPLACVFDFRENFQEVNDVARTLFRRQGGTEETLNATISQASGNLASLQAQDPAIIINDRKRFGFEPSDYARGLLSKLVEKHGSLPGPGTPIWRNWSDDIEGEPGVVRSLLMLLNSRNLTRQEHIESPQALNKQRAKRGRAPLLDYTKIVIKLSPNLRLRVGAANQKDPARLHAVRGHFKIRSSGVYWWSEHKRGDASLGETGADYSIRDV